MTVELKFRSKDRLTAIVCDYINDNGPEFGVLSPETQEFNIDDEFIIGIVDYLLDASMQEEVERE